MIDHEDTSFSLSYWTAAIQLLVIRSQGLSFVLRNNATLPGTFDPFSSYRNHKLSSEKTSLSESLPSFLLLNQTFGTDIKG